MTDVERRIRRTGAFRIGLAILVVFAILVPMAAVMAASPDPSATDPGASASAEASASAQASSEATASAEASAPASTEPSAEAPSSAEPLAPSPSVDPNSKPPKAGGPSFDRASHGAITITAIDGSSLSLKKVDGWTRTIVVTADTKITKGGKTITLADLSVGDRITFHQKRNDDGTYTIVSINVPTPMAAGQVSAVGSGSLTLKGRGDKTQTIVVNGSTDYAFGKTAAAKADVVVGSSIVALGTVSGDTFTATSIRILPSFVGGEVTAKTATSLTIKGRDGKSIVVHVASSTKFFVRKDKAATDKSASTLADIAVGDKVIASGALQSDGSIDGTFVAAGKADGHGGFGFGFGRGHGAGAHHGNGQDGKGPTT